MSQGEPRVIIELTDVSKSFDGPVLSSLSFQITSGEFVVFLGPSGCGKSTLLKMIAGLDAADSGAITRLKAAEASIVFQEPRLLPWRTALQNTLLPLELRSEYGDRKSFSVRALEALRQAGLDGASQKYPHQLSGGMKMRVAIARALVTRPRLLLMDEPFSALDEVSRFHLQEELRSLWSQTGLTIVFVTHSLSEAVALGTRHLVLGGRPSRIVIDRPAAVGVDAKLKRTSAAFQAELEALQGFVGIAI